jgi:hypothetical protein
MIKTISAIATAAVIAGTVTLLPMLSPSVEAAAPATVAKGDRLDLYAAGSCKLQSWPYYEARCVRDHNQNAGQSRAVRVVSTDRILR